MRRIKVDKGYRVLWLKMRPDTPQRYEYITIENINGTVNDFININPWTQFYDLKDRKDIPLSYAEHITMRNCDCKCDTYFNVQAAPDQYVLSDFTLENLKIVATKNGYTDNLIARATVNNTDIEIIEE